MSDINQQTKEMQSDSPKCECGYLKAGLEEGAPCPECGSTKICVQKGRKPIFYILGLLCALVSVLMSALNCIFLSMHGFNYLSVFFYIFIILPACLIALVLMVVGAIRDEKSCWLWLPSFIFILASVFVTAVVLVNTLSNFNYWG